jgi:hypothetical protein
MAGGVFAVVSTLGALITGTSQRWCLSCAASGRFNPLLNRSGVVLDVL